MAPFPAKGRARTCSTAWRRTGGSYEPFPIRAGQLESHKPRARLRPDGTVEHLEKPEYNGNPINEEGRW